MVNPISPNLYSQSFNNPSCSQGCLLTSKIFRELESEVIKSIFLDAYFSMAKEVSNKNEIIARITEEHSLLNSDLVQRIIKFLNCDCHTATQHEHGASILIKVSAEINAQKLQTPVEVANFIGNYFHYLSWTGNKFEKYSIHQIFYNLNYYYLLFEESLTHKAQINLQSAIQYGLLKYNNGPNSLFQLPQEVRKPLIVAGSTQGEIRKPLIVAGSTQEELRKPLIVAGSNQEARLSDYLKLKEQVIEPLPSNQLLINDKAGEEHATPRISDKELDVTLLCILNSSKLGEKRPLTDEFFIPSLKRHETSDNAPSPQ